MDEKYLHLIWEMKRIPVNDLRTVTGEPINVLSFGIRNDQLAGPDFFYGKIEYDGMIHHGMIEIHVKSSDWYLHKHHLDEKYNNVILHVVHEYDREVVQNGFSIPTLELKNLLDVEHYNKYREGKLKTMKILCRKELPQLPSIYLESMKSKALIQKLDDKIRVVSDLVADDEQEMLYGLLTVAFGTGVNRMGFQRLLKELPLQLNMRQEVFDGEGYVRRAGIIYSNHMNTIEWNKKGLRPRGFPLKRIKELSKTLQQFETLLFTSSFEINNFKQHFLQFINMLDLTPFMKDQLVINAIVPFLWYLGNKNQEADFKELAIELLNTRKPEDNRLTRLWKQEGISLDSAYDTQALIGVNRYYCSNKNCLSCEVGMKLLRT